MPSTDDDAAPLKRYGDDRSSNEYDWNGEPVWFSYKGNSIRLSLMPSSKRILVQTFEEAAEEFDPYHDAQIVLPVVGD